MRSLGLLILRVFLGGMMMAHGAQKVFGAFEGPGLKAFTETTRKLNLEPAEILGPVGAYSEFLGGLSILFGFLTPAGALAVINTMAVAIWKVHAKNGFWSTKRGYEFNGLIIAASASLLLTGPGKVSVDGVIFGSTKDE
jgi:putative oxidoreductase